MRVSQITRYGSTREGQVIEDVGSEEVVANRLSDPARLHTLRTVRALLDRRELDLAPFTRLIATALHAPVALVTLVEPDHQRFLSAVGLAEPWATTRTTLLSHSFCQYVVAANAPLVVTDARQEPLLAANLAIPDLGVIAYLGVPLRSGNGQPLGAVCAIDHTPRQWSADDLAVLTDISGLVAAALAETPDDRRAEARSRRATLPLKRSGRAPHAKHVHLLRTGQRLKNLSILASGVAHDFNNVLTSLLGHVELALLDAEPSSSVADYLRLVEQAGRQATTLAKHLLVYAHTERLPTEPVDVNQLLDELAPSLRADLPPTIQLAEQLTDEPTTIVANAVQLRQVVINLVTNAAEAIGQRPEGTAKELAAGRITLRTAVGPLANQHWQLRPATPTADRYLVLSVVDSGPGIPAAVITRMFEPFFTTKPAGHGIGLAAVRQIVQNCRGGIHVESQVGHGTTVAVCFPLAVQLVVPSTG